MILVAEKKTHPREDPSIMKMIYLLGIKGIASHFDWLNRLADVELDDSLCSRVRRHGRWDGIDPWPKGSMGWYKSKRSIGTSSMRGGPPVGYRSVSKTSKQIHTFH